ncbi:UPF0158 family protein [Mucilaginibacter aquariorum]|uniref:UPF0158 family protein n=1 Tax=Mucilaginibacter aquariorum TaxID=2967225 RepID=A0ABT1T6P7_9SPHI|nr:UPF0158 family protein [Mucilaginibacter aquariorum]MCQ6960133.1 UPF0158 family protein [Mucilaginibacter aquariorum]
MKDSLTNDMLKEIAGELEMGMQCFYNKVTGEIESYPKDLEFSGFEDDWEDLVVKIKSNPGDYFEFEAMNSSQAFKIMADFTDEITHIPTQNKFMDALSRKKSFANFNNLLQYYPDLRQEWFVYKNKSYLAFVKEQADEFKEFETTIKQSFNQNFCYELEYHLTRAFENAPDPEISKIWCDGVLMPFEDRQLQRENVFSTQKIETEAWIVMTENEKYQMTIKLGKRSIKKCKEGLPLSDCLPDENSLKWISFDTKNKCIELQLK